MRQPLFLVLALFVGCDQASDDPPTDGPPTTVDHIALDGFVLMHVSGGPDGSGPGLRLFDPNSGLGSPVVAISTFNVNPNDNFAVAPDGQSVAYRTAGGLIELATFGKDGDTPTMTVVRSWAGDEAAAKISWSPDGDRIAAGHNLLDPASDQVIGCTVVPFSGESLEPVIVLPGGRYVCPGSKSLEADGVRMVTDLQSVGELVTSDGQLLGANVHVPSGVRRQLADGFVFGNEFNHFGRRLPLSDGAFATYPMGPHGSIVVAQPAGFVTVYTRIEILDPPLDGHRYDLAAVFRDGVLTPAPEVTVSDAIQAYFTDGEGRRYGVSGLTGDDRVIYSITSHTIEGDPHSNALSELEVETALVEIRPDGTARGFKTSTVGDGYVYLGVDDSAVRATNWGNVVELADGDWLQASGNASNSLDAQIGWIGYLDGEPAFLPSSGQLSQDGTRLMRSALGPSINEAGTLCLRPVKRTAKTECMTRSTLFEGPVDVVGQGLDPTYADAPPLVRNVSRRAAWPGASVVVFGAHFGESGTLKVGDVTVAAASITTWSENRIAFTMDASLPENGRVVVTTAHGDSTNRVFWLARTDALTTPFDTTTNDIVPLGQGLNVVDLGTPVGFGRVGGDQATVDEALKLPDGRFVVSSSGGTGELRPTTLTIGAYSRDVLFRLEDRLADADKWQLVLDMGGLDPNDVRPGFVRVAGTLMDHGGTFVEAGDEVGRIGRRGAAARIPGTVAGAYGVPDFWREAEDGGAWVVNHLNNYSGTFGFLDHWDYPNDIGEPRFASDVAYTNNYLQGADAIGDTVLAVGGDPMGTANAGAFYLSSDGGKTFGTVNVAAGTELGLSEPLRIPASTPYFIAFESGWGPGEVFGVHRVDTDGTFTADVTDVPSMLRVNGNVHSEYRRPLETVALGERLLVFASASKSLATVDLSADAPTWQALPSAADVGNVRAWFHDAARAEVVILKVDGSAWRASDASGWSDWTAYDFAFDLPLDTRVRPLSLTRLDDGRWLLHAALSDASANPSPFAPSGWLVSPAP